MIQIVAALTCLTVDTVVFGTAQAFRSTIGTHRVQAGLGAGQKTRHAALGHVEIDALTFVAFRALVEFVAERTVETAHPSTRSHASHSYILL